MGKGTKHRAVIIMRHHVADAAETAATRCQMCVEHFGHGITKTKVRMADYSGTRPGRTVDAACGHCSNTIDELGLSTGYIASGPSAR